MSAIAGILWFDAAVPAPHQIERLTAAMRTHGPDAVHHWHGHRVALGHALLASTPESIGELQPLANEDASFVLVFDGRLDNRDELRAALHQPLRTSTDAELVLRSYQRWGEDCPMHLLGDFAFAVFDTRAQTLFCARDPLGARPFYFTKTASFIAFASHDEALTLLPGVSREPSEKRIADLLAPGMLAQTGPEAWLRDVQALLSGERMTVTATGAIRPSVYWQPEAGDVSSASDEALLEEFTAIFEAAVRARMRSVSGPAAMLSGGMDSAGIAAMAGRIVRTGDAPAFRSYSLIAADPDDIESRSIQSLSKMPGTDAHLLRMPTAASPQSLSSLAALAWQDAHPVDSTALLPALMCREAAKDGVRHLMHGASGDIVLDSPERYPAYLLQQGAWREAIAECRAASRDHTYLRGTPPSGLLALNLYSAFAPLTLKTLVRQRRQKMHGVPWGDSLDPDFARRTGWTDRWQAWYDEPSGPLPGVAQDLAEAVSRRPGLMSGLTGYGRVGRRFGVDLSDPWADRRVVEFFIRLPMRLKVRRGWTKYIVRTAFAADLAPQVRQRSDKQHLGWQLVAAVMASSHDFVMTTVEEGLEPLSRYLNPGFVRDALARYQRSPNTDDMTLIYEWATLCLWLARLRNEPLRLP